MVSCHNLNFQILELLTPMMIYCQLFCKTDYATIKGIVSDSNIFLW